MLKIIKDDQGNFQKVKGVKKFALTIIAVIFTLVAINGSFYINSEYNQGVVTHLGEYHSSTGPGIHFKIPFVQSVHKADTRTREFQAMEQIVATSSGETITLDIVINHRIDPANVHRLFKEFGSDFDYEGRILSNLTIDRIKGKIGNYSIEDFIPNRSKIRRESLIIIQDEMKKYGIDIADVQFPNYALDPRFKERLRMVSDARAQASASEQRLRKQQFETETEIEKTRAQTESEVLKANASAHRIKVESEQRAESIRRTGAAQADAIRAEGMAKAEAMKEQLQALNERGGMALIELTRAEATKNWDGVYNPSIVMGSGGEGGNVPFLPLLDVNKHIQK